VADWIVEFTPRAEKAVKRLDRSVRKRVFDKLREIQGADDPRDFLKSMTGPLTGMFRLRVGDYQVIVDIQDEAQRPTHGLDPLAQSPQSLTGAGARRPAGSRTVVDDDDAQPGGLLPDRDAGARGPGMTGSVDQRLAHDPGQEPPVVQPQARLDGA